jgi:hypothetical protein
MRKYALPDLIDQDQRNQPVTTLESMHGIAQQTTNIYIYTAKQGAPARACSLQR